MIVIGLLCREMYRYIVFHRCRVSTIDTCILPVFGRPKEKHFLQSAEGQAYENCTKVHKFNHCLYIKLIHLYHLQIISVNINQRIQHK